MRPMLRLLPSWFAIAAMPASAAPDEEKLGKAQGYPVGNARNWFYDESVRVGSFTRATPYYGYSYQFWTFPSEKRRFAMIGVYGQMIFVDPQLKLVMVQTAANATAKAGQTTLGKEADAFWRGVVKQYGSW